MRPLLLFLLMGFGTALHSESTVQNEKKSSPPPPTAHESVETPRRPVGAQTPAFELPKLLTEDFERDAVPKAIFLEPTLQELRALFEEMGIDLKATEKKFLMKWRSEPGGLKRDKMYAYTLELGKALSDEVQKKKSEGHAIPAGLMANIVERMQKAGFRRMYYPGEDRTAFFRTLAPPIAEGLGDNFAVAAFLADQKLCIVCSEGAVKPASKAPPLDTP